MIRLQRTAVPSARIAALVGAACGVGLLAGCTPGDDTAFGYGDGRLTFIACDPMDAGEIDVLVRAAGGDWETLWIAQGAVRAGRGHPFDVQEPPAGFTILEDFPERWESAAEVLVELVPFTGLGERGDPVGASVAVDAIPATGWLRSGGQTSEQPCST
jgi:hypothetical protein